MTVLRRRSGRCRRGDLRKLHLHIKKTESLKLQSVHLLVHGVCFNLRKLHLNFMSNISKPEEPTYKTFWDYIFQYMKYISKMKSYVNRNCILLLLFPHKSTNKQCILAFIFSSMRQSSIALNM